MTRIKIIVILVVIVLVALSLFFLINKNPVVNNLEGVPKDESIQGNKDTKSLEEVVKVLEEKSNVLTEDIVKQNIVGLWQSLDNNAYTLEFTAQGEMNESFPPNKTIGEWDIVPFDDGPNNVVGTVSFSKEGVFLRQLLDKGKTPFYYKVVQADAKRLVILYLHEGGILGFDRIR